MFLSGKTDFFTLEVEICINPKTFSYYRLEFLLKAKELLNVKQLLINKLMIYVSALGFEEG